MRSCVRVFGVSMHIFLVVAKSHTMCESKPHTYHHGMDVHFYVGCYNCLLKDRGVHENELC